MLDQYRQLFADALEGAERTAHGVRWTFRSDPGVEERVRTLAGIEAECCGFLRMDVTTDEGDIRWELTGSQAVAAFFDEYVRLPQRL